MEQTKNKMMLIIDIGTQSLKVSIIDSQGYFLAHTKREYKEPYKSPKNGYCEQDPKFYYDTFCSATKELAATVPALMKGVSGVLLTAFRDSAVMLDENMNVLHDTILWLDQRNAKLTKKLKWYKTAIFYMVGMLNTVKYNRKRTGAVWMEENDKETWDKVKHYVPITAYWNYLMVGKLVDSSANCSGHYPFNFKKGKWYKDTDLKSCVFGIRHDQLCDLVGVGEVIGQISKQCSIDSDIPEGLTMYSTGPDKACETLGNGCLQPNHVSISYGTACTIDIPSKRYVEPERFLPAYPAAYAGAYDIESQIYRGYWMIRWFIKEFANEDAKKAKQFDISIEDFLDNKIVDIEPGSNGLILQPYWGPGLKRPLARGAIVGFSDTHTKYHLYKAIIEGIGFALREGLDTIYRRMGKPGRPEFLVVSGGGAKNDIICQITADLFNVHVRRTQTVESSSLGAAMAGFIAINEFKNEFEAADKMVRYEKEYVPNKVNAKKYDYLYHKIYCKIYPRLNESYAELKGYSSNEIY
ncbi:MAG: FGGY-family carbohydrate kinase [Bacilli bacterium]